MATPTTVAVELDEVASGSRHRITEGELKPALRDDNRRNGLQINEVWYNYVKGLNPAAYFGIFDVVRLDTVWLDKA